LFELVPSGCGTEAVDVFLDGLLESWVVGDCEGAAGEGAGFGGGLMGGFGDERARPKNSGHIVAMQLGVRLPKGLEDAFRLESVRFCLRYPPG
jgi:hypothetical protein